MKAFLLLCIIPIAALLLILIGSAIERWSRLDSIRMSCGAGHVWWVRRDDRQAYGRDAAQCPWCRYEP